MSQKVFIPVTDEILYERPELITSPLLPFHIDHPCFRWLSAETEAVDPDTVDIDINVDLTIAATALHFAPVEASQVSSQVSSHVSLAEEQVVQVTNTEDHTYQHALQREVSVPCKDAA